MIIDDSEFSNISGDFGAQIDAADFDEENGQALVTNSVFAGNTVRQAPLHILGSHRAVSVTTTEFRDNVSDQSGAVLFDSWLDDLGSGPIVDDRLAPLTFQFAENTVSGNRSEFQGSVGITEWVQHENARAMFDHNLFTENSSATSAADVSAQKLGEGRAEADEILTFTGNTFAQSDGAAGGERAVSIGWIDAAHLVFINNTFDLPDASEAAVGIADLGADGAVTVAHNTFAGGGIAIANYDDIDASPIAVRSTAFDTPADPFTIDCDCAAFMEISDITSRSSSARLPDAIVASQAEIALSQLGDNGGLVPTRMPDNGSVLLGAAHLAPTAPLDQRGVPRPSGPGSDIGAVEKVAGVVALVENVTVTEGDTAIIPVVRATDVSLGFEAPSTATLQANNGSAKAGVDFTGTAFAADFPAAVGNAQAQHSEISIPTIARAGTQGAREFTVELNGASEGAIVGQPGTITVTVLDKDGGPGPGPGPAPDPDPDGGRKPGGGKLPATGHDVDLTAWLVGGGLVFLGGAGVLLARRRWSGLPR